MLPHTFGLLRILQVIALAIFSRSLGVSADNITTPVAAPFYSRPDIVSIALNVTLNVQDQVTPGYIFLAPYQVDQPGPYIFDTAGNLVWTGHSYVGPAYAHDFRVCAYSGSDHLCMFQGDQELGYARGHGIILDNTFRIVNSVECGGNLPGTDQHEFNLINSGSSALVTIYRPTVYDLSTYNLKNVQSYVLEGMFQEIDTQSGDVAFEWASLDHVNLSASYVLPDTTDVSGNGNLSAPWDYFHINSIDKNDEGDYLVSARHVSAIYKINGTDGSIIWQLGGKDKDFTQNFNFSYQHDARFVSANATTTIISFYDNAANGFNGSAKWSEGKVVAINNSTNQATLLQAYNARVSSESQGNLQLLPNGNRFMGHGSIQQVSEFTGDGTQIYSANFGSTGALQYRSYKFNYTTNPKTSPSIYTFAQNTSAPTAAYVSWNGATEVSSWRLYAGSSPSTLSHVGNFEKAGFETVSIYPSFAAYLVAEAVFNNGTAYRNSSVTATFVPSAGLATSCNEIQCPLAGGMEISPMLVAMGAGTVTPALGPHPTGNPGGLLDGLVGSTSTAAPASTSSSGAAPSAVAAGRWVGAVAIAGAGALLL